jgi:DNA-directed RNA polymerase specialized sigma24 family protein
MRLRYFGGLSKAQAASAFDVSSATAERYWTFAKAWLYAELADENDLW